MTYSEYSFKKILIGVLAVAFLCGEAISSEKFRIAGVVLTWYRASILLLSLYCFFSMLYKKSRVNHFYFYFFSFGFFWVCYATSILFLKRNLNIMNGAKVVISLALGLLSIFCITTLINSLSLKSAFFRYLTLISYVLIIFGVLEIVTGYHLPISRLRDYSSIQAEIKTWNVSLDDFKYLATGTCYNENDFSSMIALMIPVFFMQAVKKVDVVIARFMSILGILVIGINGSIIPIVSLILGFVLYIMLKKTIRIKALLISLIGLGTFILLINYHILIEFLGKSSLGRRSILYKDSLNLALTMGMEGMGPSGFQNYFIQHPSTSLVHDPHNLIFEIWIQYGGIILLLFAIIYISILLFIIKVYKQSKNNELLLMLIILVIYIPISFSSSSFLDKSMAYLPLGLSCLYKTRQHILVIKQEAGKI